MCTESVNETDSNILVWRGITSSLHHHSMKLIIEGVIVLFSLHTAAGFMRCIECTTIVLSTTAIVTGCLS